MRERVLINKDQLDVIELHNVVTRLIYIVKWWIIEKKRKASDKIRKLKWLHFGSISKLTRE